MSKPLVRIHNIETDEVIEREMTDAEFVEYTKSQKANQEAEAAAQAEAQAKAAQRQALLDKLGITEDEARLLLGGN
jgi:hypothetical protein